MAKLNGKLMHASLQALCMQGETYYHAVYGGLGTFGDRAGSAATDLYGFIAVTNLQRLLVARFSKSGVPMGNLCVPFALVQSVKIDKTIFGQHSVKIVINNHGKDLILNGTFATHAYAMGIPDQKKNLEALLTTLKNISVTMEVKPDAEVKSDAADKPNIEVKTDAAAQSKPVSHPQTATEKPISKNIHKGPDIVAMLNREKEYTLSLCTRLEAKYGKAEFGTPATENEISRWEEVNQVVIPDDLKAWLKFSGESKLKGIPLEFYPIARFRKEQDYVVIGKRENARIAFLIENGRYIALENDKRKNLGQMETILRFWGYDAKELFAGEELEKLQPVIEECIIKMNEAEQKAKMSTSIKDAMEYFFARNTIGALKKWRSFPRCPVRKDRIDCGLVISEPDRDGYYQWKPMEHSTPVDFTSIESELGFSLHQDIKDFVSSYYYFMLEADMGDANINIYPFLPTTNVENYVIDSFEKESYAGDYAFILKGQFFQLGGACIDGDDSYILEVNNESGEVLAVEYMDKRHIKIANSLYDLFMNAKPIWYEV